MHSEFDDFDEFNSGEMSKNEFDNEMQKLYGSPIPFEKAKSWDDLVSPREKLCLSELEDDAWKGQCPFLKKKGEFFYFCDITLDEAIKEGYKRTFRPSDDSAFVLSQKDLLELKFCCITPNSFKECGDYKRNKDSS